MSANFEKYMKMIEKIESGITQLMQDATKKGEEALESKKEVQVLIQKSKRDIESYRAARKATEEIIQTRTNELIDVNALISEMENTVISDTQQKLSELEAKIEEAKVETSSLIQMNTMISKLRELLDNQALIEGQVY
jgi:malonyl CoA-acyl carrier protein transacylase